VIRPERVVIERAEVASLRENCLPGVIERLVFQGPLTQILIRLPGGQQLQALTPNQGQDTLLLPPETHVSAYLPPAALRALGTDDPVPADGQETPSNGSLRAPSPSP
jgi:hypothetical protein